MALPRVLLPPTRVQARTAWASWASWASRASWTALLAMAAPLEAHYGDSRTIDADTLPPPGWVIVGEVQPGPPTGPVFPGLPEPSPGPAPWPGPGPFPGSMPGPFPGPMPRAYLIILDLNGAPMGATAEVTGHSPIPPGWVVISRRPVYPEAMRRGTRLVIQNRFCFAPPGPDGPPDPLVLHVRQAAAEGPDPARPAPFRPFRDRA